MVSERCNEGRWRSVLAAVGLKRYPFVAVILVLAAAFTGYYAFIPIIGPHFLKVCSKDTDTGQYFCEDWDIITALIIRSFNFLDAHNGVVTAVATLVMAMFTGTLWWATTKQGVLTEKALIVSTRAFVFLEDFDAQWSIGYPDRFVADHRLANSYFKQFSFIPKWKNSGDSPTRNLILRVDYKFIKGDIPSDFEYYFTRGCMRAMLAPKANEWSSPLQVENNLSNQALDGEINLYVWALAEYEDIFGKARWTKTCSLIKFTRNNRDIGCNFIIYGPYNGSDADDI